MVCFLKRNATFNMCCRIFVVYGNGFWEMTLSDCVWLLDDGLHISSHMLHLRFITEVSQIWICFGWKKSDFFPICFWKKWKKKRNKKNFQITFFSNGALFYKCALKLWDKQFFLPNSPKYLKPNLSSTKSVWIYIESQVNFLFRWGTQ